MILDIPKIEYSCNIIQLSVALIAIILKNFVLKAYKVCAYGAKVHLV